MRYIVVDRRDLFGGRLIAILNGLRLSEIYNAKFLMTWYTNDSIYQSYVAGLREIFAESLVEDYDDLTEEGTIIPISHPLIKSAPRDVTIIPTTEAREAGIADLLVEPKVSAADEAFLLNRRFSFYRSGPTESFLAIRRRLSEIFWEIPKPEAVERYLRIIKELNIDQPQTVSLHIRRLHWSTETPWQIDRFDSYVDTSYYCRLIDRFRQHGKNVLLASDCAYVVQELKDKFGSTVRSIEDVIDTADVTSIQKALLDLVFLSRGGTIFGPMSTFAISASVIGGGDYCNVLRYVADEGLDGNDVTGAVAFLRHEKSGTLPELAGMMLKAPVAAVCARLARRMSGKKMATQLAILGLALRFVEHEHQLFHVDWQHFVAAVRASVTGDDDRDLLAVLDWIESRLSLKASAADVDNGALADILRDIDPRMQVAVKVVRADVAARERDWPLAGTLYAEAIKAADANGLRPTGLRLRLAGAQKAVGARADELQTLRLAVEIDPRYGLAWYRLGAAFFDRGQIVDAEAALEKAVAREPYVSLYWRTLGLIREKAGRAEAAREAIMNAELCDPANVNNRKQSA